MAHFFIHVGFDKTGTTTLQKNIFPNLDNVNYLGRHYGKKAKKLDYIYKRLLSFFNLTTEITSVEEVPYAIHKDKVDIALLRKIVKNAIKPSVINLLSNEVLLRPTKKKELARKIFEIFNSRSLGINTKIIFTIRNQVDLIKSRLQHNSRYLEHKPNIDYEKALTQTSVDCKYPACRIYDNCNKKCWNGIKPVSLKYYNFYETVRLFEKLYGKNNLIILSFENIFGNDIGLKKISHLFETDLKKLKERIAIPQNRAKQGTKIEMPAETQDTIRKYYSDSNQNLASEYTLSLDQRYFS